MRKDSNGWRTDTGLTTEDVVSNEADTLPLDSDEVAAADVSPRREQIPRRTDT
jgi:hypothetical protein